MASAPLSRPNVVLRVAAWYVVLGVALVMAWRWVPHGGATVSREVRELFGQAPVRVDGDGTTLAPYVTLAMFGAGLLSLPVAWVYLLTRAKRGYQQSVVQTLVILPMVVAGVVTLVKDSVPLAFSLAGIVAAVRFRTALDDSKDAVYVFVATGIGLAAAVDLPVAIAISLVFNVCILLLWFTDFGRTPEHLEGKVADRRMQRAMERMSRTGSFVARVDNEILREMTADQLQALQERAARRARQHDPDAADEEAERREVRMRVRTRDQEGVARVVEPLLDAHAKRWRRARVSQDGGEEQVVEYVLVMRRSRMPHELAAAVRAAASPHVIGVEME